MLESGFDPQVEALLRSGVQLPAPSQSLLKLQTALNDPDIGPRALADIAEQDPVLVSALIRVANSPAFYAQRPAGSLAEIVARLGATKVLAIAVSASLRGKIPGVDAGVIDAIWARCTDVAACTFLGARHSRRKDLADVAYFSALVHDAGLCVLLRRYPSEALRLRWSRPGEFDAGALALDAAVGTEHAAVGALVVKNWKLPAVVVDAIQHHHNLPQMASAFGDAAAVSALIALGRRLADGPLPEWESWRPLAESLLGVDDGALAEMEVPGGGED